MPAQELAVFVNGEPRSVPRDCTVEGLIEVLGLARRRVAIAVNRAVVPCSGYPSHRLTAGDRVEILEAVGGG